MPWIRRMTAVVTALAALAALATAPESTREPPGLAQVGDARQEDGGANPDERGQKIERVERSGSGDSGRP